MKEHRTVRGPHWPDRTRSGGLQEGQEWADEVYSGRDAAGEEQGACTSGWGSIRLAREEDVLSR